MQTSILNRLMEFKKSGRIYSKRNERSNTMKGKNKYWVYFLTPILAFGIFGAQATPILAHDHSFHDNYDKLDKEKKQQVDTILESLKTDLEKWGLKPPQHHHDFLDNLDEETKMKAKDIFKQAEEGKISKEEADKQLSELGIDTKKDKEYCKAFENLNEEQKKQVKDIFKQKKDGTITEEQAKEKLAEFGVDLPKDPMREKFDKLDEETKAKIKERVNEAKAEFEKIGVPFPKKYEKLTE